MKINVLFVSVLVGFSLGAAQETYDFRRELETVHRPDRRDAAARCAADEFAFADGARIALVGKAADPLEAPADAGPLRPCG